MSNYPLIRVFENGVCRDFIVRMYGEYLKAVPSANTGTTPMITLGEEYDAMLKQELECVTSEQKGAAIRALFEVINPDGLHRDSMKLAGALMVATVPEVTDGIHPVIELKLSEQLPLLPELLTVFNGSELLVGNELSLGRPNDIGGYLDGGFPDNTADYHEALGGEFTVVSEWEPYDNFCWLPLYDRSFVVSHLATDEYRRKVIEALPEAVPILINHEYHGSRPVIRITGSDTGLYSLAFSEDGGEALDLFCRSTVLLHAIWVDYLAHLREDNVRIFECNYCDPDDDHSAHLATVCENLLLDFWQYERQIGCLDDEDVEMFNAQLDAVTQYAKSA